MGDFFLLFPTFTVKYLYISNWTRLFVTWDTFSWDLLYRTFGKVFPFHCERLLRALRNAGELHKSCFEHFYNPSSCSKSETFVLAISDNVFMNNKVHPVKFKRATFKSYSGRFSNFKKRPQSGNSSPKYYIYIYISVCGKVVETIINSYIKLDPNRISRFMAHESPRRFIVSLVCEFKLFLWHKETCRSFQKSVKILEYL